MKTLTIIIVLAFSLVSCGSSGPPSERVVRKAVQKEYPEARDIEVPVCAALPVFDSNRYQCGVTASTTTFDGLNYMTVIMEKKNNSWEVDEMF